MSSFLLTPAAEADLDEIWTYIEEKSGTALADRLEDDLHNAMFRLADAPGMGHTRADLADEALRVFAVHSFLIIYRTETRPLQVIRVLHGARDVQAIFATQSPQH